MAKTTTRTAKKSSSGKGKSGQSLPRPEGELRMSQMVTAYGPGALVDLIGDAILIPGLEYWAYGSGAADYEVEAHDLARNLRRRGLKLSESIPFRSPPVAMGDEQHPNIGIKAIEFPSWFLCTNRSCERLIHKRDTIFKGGERKHRCQGADGLRKLVPVRFAIACRQGHLDDFPWEWFVHANVSRCGAPELRLIDRGSGDLSDVIVKCQSCGTTRSMADARGEQSLPRCGGHRPWLAAFIGDPNAAEACVEVPKLLVRTASGGYFSQVESALTIPKRSGLPEQVNDFLARHDQRDLGAMDSLATLQLGRRLITVLRDAPDFIARLSDPELWDMIERFRALEAADDGGAAPVRESEYTTILAAAPEQIDPLYQDDSGDKDFHAVKPALGSSPLPEGVRELVLIKRLREVRALTGFTRIEPPTQNIYGEFDLDRTRAAPSLSADWLPATEIRGEGFFVELDLDKLGEWETRPAVGIRCKQLEAGWKQYYPRHQEQSMVFPGIRFYLLHTLAHLLITQVSLECGYAASAIRERIYCSPPDRPGVLPMAGFLLSTGSSGSEGTLGGLVDQGRRLQHHLDQALRRAKLCSHDPVCGRAQPDDGRPGRALLGAACHGCLFVAECSCERANQYLDRALVIPTLGVDDGQSLAFFASPTL